MLSCGSPHQPPSCPANPLWKCEKKKETNLINSSLELRASRTCNNFHLATFFFLLFIYLFYFFGKSFGVGVVEVICSVSATFGRLHGRAAVTPPVLTWTLSVLRWGKVSVYVSVSNAVKSQSTYAFASASSTHVCVIVSVCTFAGSRRFGFVHSCFIYSIYYICTISYRGVRTCIVYKFFWKSCHLHRIARLAKLLARISCNNDNKCPMCVLDIYIYIFCWRWKIHSRKNYGNWS